MFTLPPRPPKDYVIRKVTNNLLSSAQFSPDSPPRVTQPNLGRFCFPVEYDEDEHCDKNFSTEMNPVIMAKMINDARAMWIDQPGKDDFFLHDVYKKYNVRKDPKSLDPRYFIRELCFPRSYRLELDCIESARLEKLHKKCEREREDFENHFQFLVDRQKRKEKPRIRVLPCKQKSPKWWKYSEKKKEAAKEPIEYKTPEIDETTYAISYARWQEEPNLTAVVEDDPCRRKMDMLL